MKKPRLKRQSNGVPRFQGIFGIADQEGFPIDMSYEIAKERGWDIDWVEAMADALRQGIEKYDSLVAEIKMLEPLSWPDYEMIFASGLNGSEGETAVDKAGALYREIWS